MTDTPITDRTDRLEEIIETLEDGDVSLERAKALHEEGQAILEELQAELDVGEGDVTEL